MRSHRMSTSAWPTSSCVSPAATARPTAPLFPLIPSLPPLVSQVDVVYPVQKMIREIGRFRAESWGMYRFGLSRIDAQVITSAR